MPILDNPKHELFAQGLAVGKSQRHAYLEAGYKDNAGTDSAAAKLYGNIRIKARVQEIQTTAAKAIQLTIESLTEGLLRLAAKAEATEEVTGYNAARAAIMDIAKLNGLIIEKSKSEVTRFNNDFMPFVAVSPKDYDDYHN